MIVNGITLLAAAPIKEMVRWKHRENGASWGLGEAGYDIRVAEDIRFTRMTPKFKLASAMEEFIMPRDLTGIVHDKSTWARKGLSVFNTVIEPGWRGFLTLELVYHGHEVLVIPAGTGIAQVIFHKVTCPTVYDGKYQDQAAGPVPAILA